MKKIAVLSFLLFTAYACSYPSCGCEPAPGPNWWGKWKFLGYVQEDSLTLTGPARRNAYGTILNLGTQPDAAQPNSYRLDGTGSINDYSGSYFPQQERVNSGGFKVGPISSTKRSGTPAASRFEQTYFERLSKATRYEISPADRLQIKLSEPSGETMLFQRAN